ncbi:efflux RND transporter permease subunit [Hymenobacter sp.]|jgi:multidrug efflux pump subunit AcrB|uniref:efflux RND transporter permease subunit n=1 Tax=Hymenobacter sp. TaxID=1898978 RepID=UPI002EDAE7B1
MKEKEKKTNFIQLAMKHRQIVIILVVLLNVFGIYALMNMPRKEFPEFTVRQGLVIGILPGASSEEVEEQLATKIEDYLFSFAEVNKSKTYSQSKEGQTIVYVELNENVTATDVFWSKVRLGLTEQKLNLPTQTTLLTNTDFGSTAALLLSIESKDKTYKELETVYLKQLESSLRRLPWLSKISHTGLRQEQISVEVDAKKLAAYGIKPGLLVQALQAEGATTYAGELEDSHFLLPVHLGTRYHTENDLAEQIVYNDQQNNVARLQDVATLRREYADPTSYIRNNGTRALIVTLEMTPGFNIVAFGDQVDEVLAQVTKTFPADVTVRKIVDQPKVVNASIVNFLHEFGLAIAAVILVTMILLPFRVAAVAGFTIPVTVLITLAVMYFVGIELNTVTLAALIIVLGMVVDNAIVVIDNHVEKLDHGDTPWHAAWKSATELSLPVAVATLAIVMAFYPLPHFLTGTAKDFLGDFPTTIAIALGASMFVALLLVPYLNFVFIKKGLHQPAGEGKQKKSLLDYVQTGYDYVLDGAFRRPVLTVLAGVAAIVAGVLFAGALPQELFSKQERNQFAVEIYLPAGNNLSQTDSVVRQVTAVLRKDKLVEGITEFTGAGSPRFHTTYAPKPPSKNYAQLIVNTASNEATEVLLDRFEFKYRNHFPNAYVRFKQLDMLDASAPIEVRVIGDSIPAMHRVADQIAQILHQTKGVSWVRTDYEEPRQGVRVRLKQDEANRLGFSQSDVSQAMAMAVTSGVPTTTVWEGDYPVAVKLQSEKSQRNSYDDLANTYITSPQTRATVPLRQVADLLPAWEENQIVRRNGKRTLTVRVDIERGLVPSALLKDLMPKFDKLALPEGVTRLDYGGEHQNSLENQVPMAASLGISIVGIFFILLLQFRRAKTAGLIMLTMPLSLFGAAMGLKLMHYSFGFTAFMGLLSLCGIVVRNGIILIDYAQELRRDHDMNVWEAAVAAGKRRMRPIFLTSAAAAIGVVPMIISRSPLWGPLGTVICFGLIFSMILTLFVLPVLYWLFFRGEDDPKVKAEQEYEEEEEHDHPHHATPVAAGH